MEKEIASSIISVIGGIAVALIGKVPFDKIMSSRMRRRSNIPEIMDTKWGAEWYHPDGTLYTKDVVTFSKWTKNNQFEGYGEVTHNNTLFKYSMTGEVSPSRIIVLTYKAEEYPTQGNLGMACLELDVGAKGLEGYWLHQSTTAHAVVPGKVRMTQIK